MTVEMSALELHRALLRRRSYDGLWWKTTSRPSSLTLRVLAHVRGYLWCRQVKREHWELRNVMDVVVAQLNPRLNCLVFRRGMRYPSPSWNYLPDDIDMDSFRLWPQRRVRRASGAKTKMIKEARGYWLLGCFLASSSSPKR